VKNKSNPPGMEGGATNNRWRLQADLFIAFCRVGLLGFGGGPSAIPLFHQEVVRKYGWMDEEEFGDTLALANTLPGPIATKLAGYIGYKVGGKTGCINALIASVIPTSLMMVLLIGLLQKYKDIPWVQNMSASVVPVVKTRPQSKNQLVHVTLVRKTAKNPQTTPRLPFSINHPDN